MYLPLSSCSGRIENIIAKRNPLFFLLNWYDMILSQNKCQWQNKSFRKNWSTFMNLGSGGSAVVGWKTGRAAVTVSNRLFSGRAEQWEGNNVSECLQWSWAWPTVMSDKRKVWRRWVASSLRIISFHLSLWLPRFLLAGGGQETSSSVWVNFAD